MKKNKINYNLLILIFSFLVILTITSLIISLAKEKQTPLVIQELPYDYTVVYEVGIVLDSDALHFGGASPGSKSKRNVTISSEFPSTVKIRYEGPGKIIASENNFFLDQNINKSLEFTLIVPEDPEGNYSGSVFFEFYEP